MLKINCYFKYSKENQKLITNKQKNLLKAITRHPDATKPESFSIPKRLIPSNTILKAKSAYDRSINSLVFQEQPPHKKKLRKNHQQSSKQRSKNSIHAKLIQLS